MDRTRGWGSRLRWIASTCAAALAFGSSDSAVAIGQRGYNAGSVPIARLGQLSGDLTIRHARIAADGASPPLGQAAVVLHLDRRRVQGRWRTVLTLRGADPAVVQTLTGRQTLENPFLVSRFEYDDDGTPPRMYDAAGLPITLPGERARQVFALSDAQRDPRWRPGAVPGPVAVVGVDENHGPAAGLVVAAEERASRRADVERRFGPAVGQHLGHDRFLVTHGAETRELLLDPSTALPVELNTVRDGALASHITFVFEPIAGRQWVRRRVRVERLLPGTGERLASDIEFTNVSLVDGEAR